MNKIAAQRLLRDFDALHEVVGDMNRTQFTPVSVLEKLDQLLNRLEVLRDKRCEVIGSRFLKAEEHSNPKVTGIFDRHEARYPSVAGRRSSAGAYRAYARDAASY